MKLIKDISFYVCIAIIISLIAEVLSFKFLFNYLRQNVIGVLLAMLTINITMLVLIASKIHDTLIQYPKLNFSNTKKEMKISLLEQAILILLSIICQLILDNSKISYEDKDFAVNTILITVLIYAVSILWDTGRAVFIFNDELKKIKS